MAYRRNTRSRRAAPRTRSYSSPSRTRRPAGRTVRRASSRGRTVQRPQVVKIQLQMVAPPIAGSGLPSETVAEVKASKAKF